MGIPCDGLINALIEYKKEYQRGAMAELSRASGVPENVLSRLSTGRQKTVEFATWEKLNQYDSKRFPPPAIPQQAGTRQQFSPKALEKYPVLEIITDQANEAADEDFEQDVFLELCINSLKNELLKIKRGGKHSARKTG